jgi:Domain of unknown function (DUF397)
MSAGADNTSLADSADVRWNVSSRCAGNGSCVEVALRPGGEAWVRDGKNPATGGILVFGRIGWASFLAGVQAGEFSTADPR